MNRVLIVFAKEPVLGSVKTRLKSCFVDKKLLRLYRAFVKDTLDTAMGVRCGMRILAFLSPNEPHFLKSVGRDFELIEQKGANLGERMHNAFIYAKRKKAKKIVIIGTDSPTLPREIIEKSFRELDRRDLVLRPSNDGGYYLVGLKEPCFNLFKNIQWSFSDVLDKTLNKAKNLDKTVALLDKWYDVDDRRALTGLKKDLRKERNKKVAKYTREVLKI